MILVIYRVLNGEPERKKMVEKIEATLTEMLNVSTDDPKEYDGITSRMKREILETIRDALRLSEGDCEGVNFYKDVDELLHSMRLPPNVNVEPANDGWYKVDTMMMKIYLLGKPEPLKFEKKEVVLKWKLV